MEDCAESTLSMRRNENSQESYECGTSDKLRLAWVTFSLLCIFCALQMSNLSVRDLGRGLLLVCLIFVQTDPNIQYTELSVVSVFSLALSNGDTA